MGGRRGGRGRDSADTQALIAKAMSEQDLLDNVMVLAQTLGFETYHTHRSDRSPPGFPDLCMAGHGRVIFAELKSEKGRVGAHQIRWFQSLKETRPPYKVDVYLWRPTDWVNGTIERVLRTVKSGEQG